jgi:hypothetical protein
MDTITAKWDRVFRWALVSWEGVNRRSLTTGEKGAARMKRQFPTLVKNSRGRLMSHKRGLRDRLMSHKPNFPLWRVMVSTVDQ